MSLSVFSRPIGEVVVNQYYPANQQDPKLAEMIEENRRRRENLVYGLGFWIRSWFTHPIAVEQPKERRWSPSTLNPKAWPMPEVNLSSEPSQVIKRLVEKRGLVYQPLTLDSGQTPDLSIREPQKFLLSQSDLSGVDKSKPVILLAHGYTATTYEWDDLARYIDQNANGDVRYSQILLGGHGRSLEDFKNSNWQDWGKPILDEYQALVAKGFTNISLAGSSTACALILEQLNSGAYRKGSKALNNIFLIDPIVEPSGFWMRPLIRILALFQRSYPPQQAFSPEEFSRWYGNRPFTTINSLNDLTWKVQRALSTGIQLPQGTRLTVWASQGDPTVNPDGYKLIQQGIKPGPGGSVSVYPINSRFHVFTRLSGRPEVTVEDRQFQEGSHMSREAVLDWVAKAPIPVTPRDRQIQKETFDQLLSAC